MQRSSSGLGPVLRKVRLSRGVSLEEASRDTRIRREFLEAIEEEEFDRLLGEVHVRGCLRTYATYLGVPADRALEVYARRVPEADASPQPPQLPVGREMNVRRRRDNARLFIMGATALLVLAAAFGILSAREPAPAPAPPPSPAAAVEAGLPPKGIEVAVLAQEPVEVTVRIDDGPPQQYSLAAGEGRSFAADVELRLLLASGATARVTVNGKDLGFPGKQGKPWHGSWRYGTEDASAGG